MLPPALCPCYSIPFQAQGIREQCAFDNHISPLFSYAPYYRYDYSEVSVTICVQFKVLSNTGFHFPSSNQLTRKTNEPTNQQIKEPTNQPANQPTNQPTNQRKNQQTNKPIKPMKQATNTPIKPTKERTNERTNEPGRQTVQCLIRDSQKKNL
jgi:hemoglobin/transferrin/lactoferrin receptor protein